MDDREDAMSIFKQALANAKLTIVLLMGVNFILAIITFCAIYGLSAAPSSMTFYVPPSVPNSGIVLKAQEVPKSTVYSFTYYVWQSLQTWLTNGEQNYQKNLVTFSPYLSDTFRNELSKEAHTLDAQGMLLNHEQTTFDANDNGYDQSNVKYLGHNTWLVHLVMRTINRIAIQQDNNSFSQSHIVSDATTSYVFKVIKTEQNSVNNRWSLKIAGFAVPPKKMMIYQ